ncbi:hypothetical protein CAEBREN_18534 [Caenorhabditis brenneri]|uniref:Uncharacterized protein n=1 Tax=Caenorhabditis brenneri TaxID=135651 RepID=G0PF12_CAEBE|nr:hypothetical protein CAEBREN_18534 [Caenorhabditis brenneri]
MRIPPTVNQATNYWDLLLQKYSNVVQFSMETWTAPAHLERSLGFGASNNKQKLVVKSNKIRQFSPFSKDTCNSLCSSMPQDMEAAMKKDLEHEDKRNHGLRSISETPHFHGRIWMDFGKKTVQGELRRDSQLFGRRRKLEKKKCQKEESTTEEEITSSTKRAAAANKEWHSRESRKRATSEYKKSLLAEISLSSTGYLPRGRAQLEVPLGEVAGQLKNTMDAVNGIGTEQQITVQDNLMAAISAKKKRAPPRKKKPAMHGTHENLANGQQVNIQAQGRYHPYHQPQYKSQPARGTISRPMNLTPDHQRQQQFGGGAMNNVAALLAPLNDCTEKPLEPLPQTSDEIPTEDQEQLIHHQINQPTSSGSDLYPFDYMQNTRVSIEGELKNITYDQSVESQDSTCQSSQNLNLPPNQHQSAQQGAAPKKRPRNVLSKEAIEYNAREFARAYGFHDDQPSGAIPRPFGLSDADLERINDELIADFFIDITAPDDDTLSPRSEISTPSDSSSSVSGSPSTSTHNTMITQHVPQPQNVDDNGVSLCG